MKRKLSFAFLAAVSAMLFPLAAAAQIAPDKPARATDEPVYKWQAYAGVGYTSLNQVNQSRYGLIGPNLAITRNWGRYFGLTADGAFYSAAVGSGNPGSPTVSVVLFGPELHVPLSDRFNAFARILLGGEHTGGETMTPNISFAGGGGGGIEYQMNQRFSLRLSGDAIAASFSVRDNTSGAFSPHMTRNSRAGLGIAYRF